TALKGNMDLAATARGAEYDLNQGLSRLNKGNRFSAISCCHSPPASFPNSQRKGKLGHRVGPCVPWTSFDETAKSLEKEENGRATPLRNLQGSGQIHTSRSLRTLR